MIDITDCNSVFTGRASNTESQSTLTSFSDLPPSGVVVSCSARERMDSAEIGLTKELDIDYALLNNSESVTNSMKGDRDFVQGRLL